VNTYNIGPLAMEYVFRKSGLTNMADMQAVMDAVEVALAPVSVVADFIEKQNIHCVETIYQSDRVIENAYEFIEALVEIVGYQESDDDDE